MGAKYFLDLFGGVEEITEQEWDIIFGKMHMVKCPCTVIVTQKFDDNRENLLQRSCPFGRKRF